MKNKRAVWLPILMLLVFVPAVRAQATAAPGTRGREAAQESRPSTRGHNAGQEHQGVYRAAPRQRPPG